MLALTDADADHVPLLPPDVPAPPLRKLAPPRDRFSSLTTQYEDLENAARRGAVRGVRVGRLTGSHFTRPVDGVRTTVFLTCTCGGWVRAVPSALRSGRHCSCGCAGDSGGRPIPLWSLHP